MIIILPQLLLLLLLLLLYDCYYYYYNDVSVITTFTVNTTASIIISITATIIITVNTISFTSPFLHPSIISLYLYSRKSVSPCQQTDNSWVVTLTWKGKENLVNITVIMYTW